jgi:hypothetical protein
MSPQRVSHRARITWSAAHLNCGLPACTETTDPSWLLDATPSVDAGWSLVCLFHQSPRDQGNPSEARVHFLVDDAPHHILKPGASLRLFERATKDFATVEILE